ncbi:MAG: cytochrome P450 [Pseudomonadales bacterium]|nr:cytochrome P450 [Halioglobus sp.]MCP5123698.1 cytochrome P450 [Pseudomonadales bacterium]MCP5192019.1 cytochrome P450 [Pseudomonadales bacterium]
MAKCPADFDFFAPEVIESPFEFYQVLREQAPVYLLPGTNIYLLSRLDDIRQAAKDTETFSSDFRYLLQGPEPSPAAAEIYKDGYDQVDTLLTMDPPRHKVYRSLINKVFSARRVAKMQDYMEQIADELIDNIIDKGECEFVRDFATPLPVYVIADQLGVPRADLRKIKAWSDAFASRLGGMVTPEAEIENAHLIVEYQQYMVSIIRDRRAQPRDDMISDLANTTIEDGRLMTLEELLSMIQQLLVAGNETTTSAIAGGLLSLIQLSDQLQVLLDDPAIIDNAVEEILRLETPSAGLWRVVTRDTRIRGVAIPAGSLLMLRYAAGNRDASVFSQPEVMDVCRANAEDHLAFGQGTHFCPGAMLARKEMQVAFRALLQRLTNIRLVEGKNDLTHWPNVVLRGLKSLHITFEARV